MNKSINTCPVKVHLIPHLLNVHRVQEVVPKILRQKRLIKLTDKSLEHIRHVMLTKNIYI